MSIFGEFGIHDDERGSLRSLSLKKIPFEVKRIFTLNVRDTKRARGGHAHKTCWQVIIPVDSPINLNIFNQVESRVFTLVPGSYFVVPPMTWLEIRFTKTESSVLVLASDEYEEADYIRSRDEFRESYLDKKAF